MTQPHRTATLPAHAAVHASTLMWEDRPVPVQAVTVRGSCIQFHLDGAPELKCQADDLVTVWYRFALQADDLTPGLLLPRPDGQVVRILQVSAVGDQMHWFTDDPAEFASGQARRDTWVEVWPHFPDLEAPPARLP